MRKKCVASTPWVLGALLIFTVVIFPLILILNEVIKPPTNGWTELVEKDPGGLLAESGLSQEIPESSNLFLRSRSTLIMLVGVGSLSLIIGVALAWIVSVWEFPMRRQLSFLLILPLAIPSYIAATAFKLVTIDTKNAFAVSFREQFGAEAMIRMDQVWNYSLSIIVLSLGFYPYVYIAARSAFSTLSQSYLEAARTLGLKPWLCFLKVAIPLARPAILGGLMLVLLETLNEFGAMKILGINTLTTEIFYAWTNLNDKNTAVRIAGCIMILVFILLILEILLRGGKKFHAARSAHSEFLGKAIPIPAGILCSSVCILVIITAFGIPMYEIVRLVSYGISENPISKFYPYIVSSLSLAAGASMIIMLVALFLGYAHRLIPTWWMQFILKACNLGYAIPGAILGVALISSTAIFNQSEVFYPLVHYLFYSSIIGAIIAYLIRFLTVGLNPIESGLKNIRSSLDEISHVLGKGSLKTFFQVHLPLLKYSISGGLLILFIDILKELPLTLIINQETLATKTYSLFQKEERYAEGAIPALLLILTGIAGLILIRSIFKNLKN